MQVHEYFSLQLLNAFKVKAVAKYFTAINSVEDLREVFSKFEYKSAKLFILGHGTNTLFTQDFDGLVIKSDIKGINIISETENDITLEVGGGESWNGFVQYSVNNNLSGIENMTLIPGTVGAAPVQNIAAYGQNFEDIFVSLEAFNKDTSEKETFDYDACKFGYRDSYFKNGGKGKYIITKVIVRLSRNLKIDTSYYSRYESIMGELAQFTQPPFNVRDISKAVTRIRERKFPDWEKVGTAGSFFLNPVITIQKLKELQQKYPDIQYYPIDKLSYPTPNDPTFDHANHVKVPAGWLLEELGWKGKRIGDVGTSENQSLVVINYGKATAKDILDFTRQMQADFKNAYGIELIPEVNII